MEPNNFGYAFQIVIGIEKGYVDNPKDPGGETKYGISKRSYPDINIKELTLDDAKKIYKRDYWDKLECDTMPWPVCLVLFDSAVNHGITATIKMAQKVVELQDNGVFDNRLKTEMLNTPPYKFVTRFIARRLSLYTSLKTWDTFGRGWTNRIATILKEC